ncbi:unnamed protein product [Hermetia illucens]|uniref:Chitin-binding type-4 domain-containing protein n=1 Tax=Hermetia illucens TaxID=343691 RepID=A0A7R8V5Z1_HERIL|nr:uncharacterized protein LOC119658879 [Hermetia illucens]CAD7093491.1 unnamed protein product [Hermetia illucens]
MFKIFVVLCSVLVANVYGHGMMLNPVGRQSRWRYDSSAPPNYTDNELYCGGITALWQTYGGKCGLCGDSYGVPTPRPHELGGTYGAGVVVGKYSPGQNIPVSVKLSANHKGYFKFDLCNLDVFGKESEECFAANAIRISNGSDRYDLPSFDPQTFELQIQAPSNLKCQHCVLRWTYVAANNWGTCSDGSNGPGCGPQETFKNCADITIL